MEARSGRILEMGGSTDEFNVLHPDTEAGYTLSATKLTQLVERGRGLAATQREGVVDARAGIAEKRVVRRAMLAGPIRHCADVGKLAAEKNHELGRSFIFKPSGESDLGFRTAAGSMAAAAHTNKELLMEHGLSESVLDLFVQLLDRFDAAVSLAARGRAAHMAATKELNVVAREIRRTVRVMDARNRLRFKDDGQLLGEWISRTKVRGSTRVSSPRDTVSPREDTPGPNDGNDVRPAA